MSTPDPPASSQDNFLVLVIFYGAGIVLVVAAIVALLLMSRCMPCLRRRGPRQPVDLEGGHVPAPPPAAAAAAADGPNAGGPAPVDLAAPPRVRFSSNHLPRRQPNQQIPLPRSGQVTPQPSDAMQLAVLATRVNENERNHVLGSYETYLSEVRTTIQAIGSSSSSQQQHQPEAQNSAPAPRIPDPFIRAASLRLERARAPIIARQFRDAEVGVLVGEPAPVYDPHKLPSYEEGASDQPPRYNEMVAQEGSSRQGGSGGV